MIPLICYFFSTLLFGWSYYKLLKRSRLGIALVASDFLFILGICIYPIALILGWVIPGIEGDAYLSRHRMPGFGLSFHVLMAAVGAAMGTAFSVKGCKEKYVRRIEKFSSTLVPNTRYWLYVVAIGLLIYATYFLLVGFDVAMANAAAARGGDFEGFGGGDKYLFLKTVGALSLYACAAIPFLARFKTKHGRYLFIAMYLVLLAAAFANSISRIIVLKYLVAPSLIFFAVSGRGLVRSTAKLAVMSAIFFVAIAVALYGKSFGQYLRHTYGAEQVYTIEAFNEGRNPAETLLRNGEFLWYSSAAGIEYNEDDGVLLPPREILLSVLGFIPQRVMSSLGIESLDYRQLAGNWDTLVCINSREFGLMNCTAPPHWIGYSAYFIPYFGGLLFAFIRFYFFERLARYWGQVWKRNAENSWAIYLFSLLFVDFMSLIPGAISGASFVLVLLFFVFVSKCFLLRIGRGISSRR